ncbi:MAG: hypothetical protein P8J89_00045 [Phycisphaerales bacterium]|nr:hypothetical protein [Phycisphaerales bacterium]
MLHREDALISLVLCLTALPVQGTSTPTWHGEVEGIVEQHCSGCHSSSGPAPFPLRSYEDVANRSNFIEVVIREGIMPPWLPSDSGLPLQSHRGLSKREIQTVSDWIRGGRPIGQSGEVSPKDDRVAGIPEADLSIRMTNRWMIPAEGGKNWGRRERDKRTFVLPLGNDRSLRVREMRYETSAPKAVHAVSFLADDLGHARYVDEREEGPGHYMTGDVNDRPSGELGSVGIGSRSLQLPPGYHWEIPARSDLVMQVHFRPTGRSMPLQESVDMWFVKDEMDSRAVRTLLNMIWRVDVPTGEISKRTESWMLPVDVDLLGFTARGSGVLTELDLTAHFPDGRIVKLLDIPDFDPHWRQTWLLEKSSRLPAGTRVVGSWALENTNDNPRNPFIPLQRYVTARRTGVLATMLHVAAVDSVDDEALKSWHQGMIRSRPAAQKPTVEPDKSPSGQS